MVSLAISVGAVAAVALAGSIVTARAVPGWYAEIEKPAWNPPDRLFGPVWTVLYGMMAVAAWKVYLEGGFEGSRRALTAYAVQLVLNGAWTMIFFGWKMPGAAFGEIVVLWCCIAWTLWEFRRESRLAGWLMAPYLGWVTFASALNFAIWRLNAPG
ncbi:MAG: tryptophan-rich sensory protein [Planctomycetes bacterium]|nr:tryptophan-rich sensory protein [Planctomycetota bacterium]